MVEVRPEVEAERELSSEVLKSLVFLE